MSEDFFPTPPVVVSGRRFARGTRSAPRAGEEWPPGEDLVLIPVLAACESPLAYGDACEALGRMFRRRPQPADGQVFDLETFRDEQTAQIEMRTETRHISAGADAEVMNLARAVYRGRRAGPVARWGEGEILRQWAAKREGDPSPYKNRGPWPDLMTLLDRRADDPDADAFVETGCPMPEPRRGRSPFDPDRGDRTARLVGLWTRAAAVLGDYPLTRAVWAALLDWLFAGD